MDMTEVEYKDHTTTLAHISSDPSRPVRPVLPTGRTGPHYLPTLPVRLAKPYPKGFAAHSAPNVQLDKALA